MIRRPYLLSVAPHLIARPPQSRKRGYAPEDCGKIFCKSGLKLLAGCLAMAHTWQYLFTPDDVTVETYCYDVFGLKVPVRPHNWGFGDFLPLKHKP